MKYIKIFLFLFILTFPTLILAQKSNTFKPSDGIYINVFPDTNSFLNGTFAIDDRGFVEIPLCDFTCKIIEEVTHDTGLEDQAFLRVEGARNDGLKLPIVEVSTRLQKEIQDKQD